VAISTVDITPLWWGHVRAGWVVHRQDRSVARREMGHWLADRPCRAMQARGLARRLVLRADSGQRLFI